ncbi:MAG TPA: patatin-like phospholipase family protein [Blastocatellia bacterium]|jgi:predicted acylesterase/phospholipase RssA|nr:patatin-like phospholipase family protein [Blastocatellia bacterium]
MTASTNDDLTMAKEILRGKAAKPKDIFALATRLKQQRAFGHARRVLAIARKSPEANAEVGLPLKLAQQHALCTYKDPDLPLDSRLDQALEILGQAEHIRVTRNQDSLAIAGAVYKLKWEIDSQKQQLERSLSYYLRGYKEGIESDHGYNAINAAYILDLLAHQEEEEAARDGASSDTASARRDQARRIREELIDTIARLAEQPGHGNLQNEYWLVVTVAEAYFGLGRYQEAIPLLKKAADTPDVPAWQYETTARQLASLAMLSGSGYDSPAEMKASGAWQALLVFLRGSEAGVRTAFLGKVGLALSGGGFRASLFHVGVLAKLAELDMLRHVEVLSCVSGGSIIGAHYYLEVRRLLEEKEDSEITREDYIEIIRRVEKDFLDGVQRNVRTRVAGHLPTTLKMIFRPSYSRTMRVGELYESEIFSRVKDGGGDEARWLNDLFVEPKGEAKDFRPKYDNWRRDAKVPNLILNATPLNTGHNWQFTASWMGEPPPNKDNEVDGNYRLRRLYYKDAPEQHKKIRLGHAVAASSCVPGLFEPIALTSLYDKKVVRLVDGGVHDNQGVAALLDQDCTVLLVSDASGQMHTIDDPKAGILGVPLRSNSILMSRVREAQYLDLVARRRSSLLRGFMFIHLKKGLQSPPIDWKDCEDPYDRSGGEEFYDDRTDADSLPLTRYGILKKVQMRLSAIRTDLDSFSDVEAFALMTSGYRMAGHEFGQCIEGFPVPQDAQERWRFLDIERPMKQVAGCKQRHEDLIKLLEVGSSTGFKVWKISTALRYTSYALGVVALAAMTWVCARFWREPLPSLTIGRLLIPILVIAGIALVGRMVLRAERLQEKLVKICLGVVLVVIGWIAAHVHLLIFDWLFLRLGKVPPAPDKSQKVHAAGK